MAGIQSLTTSPQGQSEGRFGKGQGLIGGRGGMKTGKWEPSVVNLILLVLLEFALYIGARFLLGSVHGG
jgi:hypothetical protein